MTNSKSKHAAHAAEQLRRKGWTLRTAAPLLGVSHVHLHYVITGERHSRRLLSKLDALPHRSSVAPAKATKGTLSVAFPIPQATRKAVR